MIRYLTRRAIQSVVLLFVVSIVIFAVVHSAPGGPAILLDPEIDPALAEEFREQLGLNDPLPVQYARWLGNVFQLNFGTSFQHGLPVTELIGSRFPNSLLLAGSAMLIATTVALVLGTVSALRRYSIYDYGATIFAFLGLSIPGFWLGIMLIIIFSVQLGWLPSGGMASPDGGGPIDRLKHLILPAVSLSSFAVAQLTRYSRSAMIEVLKNDYIRTARAKGLSERVVIYRHAMKNALIPVVTVIGVITPRILGGAVITETVFTWPGMGRLAVNAAFTRDFPLVMGVTLFVAVLVILSNLITDVLYGFLDPRIKFE